MKYTDGNKKNRTSPHMVIKNMHGGNRMIADPPQGTPCLRGRVAIPWGDITGVKSLLAQGKTKEEIANVFGVSRRTIDRVIKLNKCTCGECEFCRKMMRSDEAYVRNTQYDTPIQVEYRARWMPR